ncbi:Guanine nucleotide-binding protein G(I)/G(S)/G(O) subunit gamma-12 [Vulpes lagopus]
MVGHGKAHWLQVKAITEGVEPTAGPRASCKKLPLNIGFRGVSGPHVPGDEHARSDPFLIGTPTSDTPFKDKNTCITLQRNSEAAPRLFSTKQIASSSLEEIYLQLTW